MRKAWQTAAALFAALALSLPFAGCAAEQSVVLPPGYSLERDATPRYESLTAFKGRVSLAGELVALATTSTIDGDTERHLHLVLIPAPDQIGRLPKVLVSDETPAMTIAIELDYLDDTQAEAITTVFGPAALNNIRDRDIAYRATGVVTLEAYSTGLECNTRFHYARFVDLAPPPGGTPGIETGTPADFAPPGTSGCGH